MPASECWKTAVCKRSKPGLRFPTVAAAITAALIVNIATAESPRNVLLLIADDVGLDLGSYGSKAVPTPNLDRLAADGVRFTNAFCTTSSCSASRSVIYSGLFNHTNGQFGHAHLPDHFRQYDDVETMFTLLARHGYRTGILGKLHVEPASLFPSVAKAGPLDHRSPSDLAATTKNFLADAGDKPFLLVVGFADAHRARHGFDHECHPRRYLARATQGDPGSLFPSRLAGIAEGSFGLLPGRGATGSMCWQRSGGARTIGPGGEYAGPLHQ